jgi:creatinine amidohydrolase
MDYVAQHLSMPKEIKAERDRMPVAYLGLGILEWHGEHNAAGLDGVKAEGIANHFARKFGGVVVPTLFWGDNREEVCELVFKPELIPEATIDHTVLIADKMGYDLEKLKQNGQRSRSTGGWRLWIELLVHMFFELESFGYASIVPIPGHYPLFNPLDEAIARYHSQGGTCDIFTIKDTLFDPNGNSGDHAAKFETSLMMAMYPELVDLGRLDTDLTRPNIGVLGEDPRLYASREFGLKVLDKFDELLKEHLIQHRLYK